MNRPGKRTLAAAVLAAWLLPAHAGTPAAAAEPALERRDRAPLEEDRARAAQPQRVSWILRGRAPASVRLCPTTSARCRPVVQSSWDHPART